MRGLYSTEVPCLYNSYLLMKFFTLSNVDASNIMSDIYFLNYSFGHFKCSKSITDKEMYAIDIVYMRDV